MLAFDSKRYVGAQIGIHGPDRRQKVGTVGRLRNVEYLFVAGDRGPGGGRGRGGRAECSAAVPAGAAATLA